MGDINLTQGSVLGTVEEISTIEVSQSRTLVAINFPAEHVNISQGFVQTTLKQATTAQVAQVSVLAAVRGRIDNPKLRAWTFTLDGHDFYVLRLGDDVTLVYDVYSEQWVDFSSPGLSFWRPNCGTAWDGGQKLGSRYGSNIVVGDDNFGLLWVLNPEQPYDDSPDGSENALYFERIIMGQVPIRGREVLPCFATWLTADMGQPAYEGAGVRLEISDDAGKTFDDMGLVTVTSGEDAPELSWYSLGQIEAPGRLFKITDDGAIARIDGMEMNDPDEDDAG